MAETTGGEAGSGISIILADDHEVVREGLRRIVEAEDDMGVVAEVGDAADARTRVSRLKPAILILDLDMPGEASLPSLPKLQESSPETAVIVMTMEEDSDVAEEAFRLGAKAFIVKDAAGAELVDAIRTAARGETYTSPSLVAAPEKSPRGLTPRETEVLGLVVAGHTNREIAEFLAIGTRTVETHRASINRKLGMSNRDELVSFAHEHAVGDER
jgi:two-component system, NarL family, response regulator NreC